MSQIKPEYVTHDVFIKMGDASDIVTGKGVSPFKAGEYPMSNLIAVYKARNVIYVKRGPGGAIVSAKSDANGLIALTPKEKREVAEDISNDYGLDGRKSPFAVSNQPINWIKMGSTIQELQPFEETLASTSALAGIAGVPMALIPKTTESKFANLDIAERNFYENKIIPEAEAFCHFLTQLCRFDEIGAKVVVSFDGISALQDDAQKAAQALLANTNAATQLYDDGHITQNELRALIGHEPIEGGDDYIDEEERLAGKFPPNPINNTETPGNIDSEVDPVEGDENPPKKVLKLFKGQKRKLRGTKK